MAVGSENYFPSAELQPPPGCPYTVGTALTLQSLPHSGASSSMQILTVNIENDFLPFTHSQVLKVKLNNSTPDAPEPRSPKTL